ncbi:MAG TPA: hypothetical protein VER98_16555 [Terriglobia bacterium]|nr:hypothetical protein [Terriglobia bacterium]
MMFATAVPSDTTWLQAPNYKVTALNAKLAACESELKRALQLGLAAFPDTNRRNFYDVELPNGWAYIHVRDDNRTVYLVAHLHV